jgi:hypothetical protein
MQYGYLSELSNNYFCFSNCVIYNIQVPEILLMVHWLGEKYSVSTFPFDAVLQKKWNVPPIHRIQ